MSLGLIEDQIRIFLASADPEVICIIGRWGVGKTYAWKKLLREAAESGQIALKSYSYVSLFGVNSLEQAKLSVFENQVHVSAAPDGLPKTEWLVEKVKAAVKSSSGKKTARMVLEVPFLSRFTGSLGPMWFAIVKETIVCIDDIERRGSSLSIRDVLGLVSLLKEQKQCKVVLVLNDDALTKADQEEFQRYFEKTVDTAYRFAPSPEESTRIALKTAVPTNKQLAEHCITLGISNIRVIKKIERAIQKLQPLLNGFDGEVTRVAVHSLTMLGWSIYEPGIAPSLEYIQRLEQYRFTGSERETIPDDEAAWNALLEAYRFTHMDQFDKALLDGIQKGYFDPALIATHGAELNANVINKRQDTDFAAGWEMFHDSFSDNQNETLDIIQAAFFRNVQNISPLNLNGTVTLFKELGRPEVATRMIEHYVSHRASDRKALDLNRYPFRSEIHDPDIIAAFQKTVASVPEDRNPEEVLLSMRTGWSEDDLAIVAALQPDDFYAFFKNSKGDRLRHLISAALQFDRITGASPAMKEISARARQALERIGRESPINARRVKKYGITVGDEEKPTS
jgi:hypothetical protein